MDWFRQGLMEAGLAEGGWRGADRPQRYEEAEWTGLESEWMGMGVKGREGVRMLPKCLAACPVMPFPWVGGHRHVDSYLLGGAG